MSHLTISKFSDSRVSIMLVRMTPALFVLSAFPIGADGEADTSREIEYKSFPDGVQGVRAFKALKARLTSPPTTVGEGLARAIRCRDGVLFSRIIDQLRFRQRLNYAACLKLAREAVPGLTEAEFEEMSELADEADSCEA